MRANELGLRQSTKSRDATLSELSAAKLELAEKKAGGVKSAAEVQQLQDTVDLLTTKAERAQARMAIPPEWIPLGWPSSPNGSQ